MRRFAVSIAWVLLTVCAWRAAALLQAQGNRQQLDVDGALDLRLASNGDIALLVTQGPSGDLAVFRSVDGGPFVPTEFVVSPDILERRVGGVWATTRGFFTVQYTRRLLPRLSRSVDAGRWETIQSPAFDTPAEITGMVQLASGDLLAVGALRLGSSPAGGPFRAAMWRSGDGITWRRVPLDGEIAGASSFGSIATLGTTVVIAGVRSGPAVWRSDDGGTSWALAVSGRHAETVSASGGRFVGFPLLAFVETPDIVFTTSIDGRTWREGIASGVLDDGLQLFPRQLATTPSGIFFVGAAELDLRKRLDWCYASLAECSRGRGSIIVLHTTTGDTWRAIDVDSLLGPGLQAFAVADVNASTVLAGAARGRVEIIRIPRASWRFVTSQSRPPLSNLPPLATADRLLAPATVYRYPKRVHCGLEWLGEFNGQTWKLTRQLVGTPGDPRTLRTLPQIQETLLGTIRLTTPDTIEYAIEGVGVIAVYGPTKEILPMCI